MDRDTPRRLTRLLRILASIEDGILVLLLLLLIVMAGTQIFLRNVLGTGMMDIDSLSRVLVLWLGMAGAVVASRRGKHINVDVLSPLLRKKARDAVRILIDLFTTFVCVLVAYHSARFVQLELEAGSTVFAAVPAWAALIVLPVAFGLIALHYLLFALDDVRTFVQGDQQP